MSISSDFESCKKCLSTNSISTISTTTISIALPPPTPIDSTFVTHMTTENNYWKTNFIVVLLPFAFLGIPIHLLLQEKREVKSITRWFQQIFCRNKPFINFLTGIFLVIALFTNGFFIYLFVILFHKLVILGEIRENIYEDLVNIFRTAPIVVPLDLVWVYGYLIRKLLVSFDRISYPVIQSKQLPFKLKFPSYRRSLTWMYLLVIINQGIQLILFFENIKTVYVDQEPLARIKFWIDFAISLMYNLMFPVYMAFCCAIHFEFKVLAQYITGLIQGGFQPDFTHFDEVKRSYKEIANHVMLVNDICNVYFSWVFFVVYTSMYNELVDLVRQILSSLMMSDGPLGPIEVRMFVGNLFSTIFQLIILGYAVWFAIIANDQARYVHVRLNDFITEPDVILTPELYKSFRMLKFYMHSRMETERPALLSIAAVGFGGFSCVYTYMVSYRMIH